MPRILRDRTRSPRRLRCRPRARRTSKQHRLIRTGDAVYVDLRLGNHGNEHRDFKLASKITLDKATLEVIARTTAEVDLKPELVDVGYTEGRLLDRQVRRRTAGPLHRRSRWIRSSITASRAIDQNAQSLLRRQPDAHDQHPRGLIQLRQAVRATPWRSSEKNPVAPHGAGTKSTCRVLLKGKPLADARVIRAAVRHAHRRFR
ncbi:MAG: hypothetical protein U0992_22370 [Planctomycetaceae bacterium]